MVDTLLDLGVDADLLDSEGHKALYYLAEYNFSDQGVFHKLFTYTTNPDQELSLQASDQYNFIKMLSPAVALFDIGGKYFVSQVSNIAMSYYKDNQQKIGQNLNNQQFCNDVEDHLIQKYGLLQEGYGCLPFISKYHFYQRFWDTNLPHMYAYEKNKYLLDTFHKDVMGVIMEYMNYNAQESLIIAFINATSRPPITNKEGALNNSEISGDTNYEPQDELTA